MASIVISTRNAHQVDELFAQLQGIAGETAPGDPDQRQFRGVMQASVAAWSDPAYEQIRPEPEDLAGIRLQLRIGSYPDFEHPVEGTLTQDVIDRAEPAQSQLYGCQVLVDGSLDAFAGTWWYQSPYLQPDLRNMRFYRVGNLRDQTPERMNQLLAGLPGLPPLPSDCELALQYGDTRSRKVHSDTISFSLRRKWIAGWRADHDV